MLMQALGMRPPGDPNTPRKTKEAKHLSEFWMTLIQRTSAIFTVFLCLPGIAAFIIA
jgi:hypothetical protein